MPTNVEAGLSAMEANKAFDDSARLAVTVYVLIVLPSWAVTIIIMGLGPKFNEIGVERTPDATDIPLTFMVAPGLLLVGTTVILEVKFAMASV